RTSLAAAAFFSITAPAPTASYTLSLHDALPIFALTRWKADQVDQPIRTTFGPGPRRRSAVWRGLLLTLGLFVVGVVLWNVGNVRSEEHTSELQSRENLVCRLLLEKKNSAMPHVL